MSNLYGWAVILWHELVRKVFDAQKRKPVKNDWIHTIEEDKKEIELRFNDDQIRKLSKIQYKKLIKQKVQSAAFHDLQNRKKSHSKVSI